MTGGALKARPYWEGAVTGGAPNARPYWDGAVTGAHALQVPGPGMIEDDQSPPGQ